MYCCGVKKHEDSTARRRGATRARGAGRATGLGLGLGIVCALVLAVATGAAQDQPAQRRPGWGSVLAVHSEFYAEACGACHFAYQPALLNAASWRALVQGSENHFGEDLGLDQETRDVLQDYLSANCDGARRAQYQGAAVVLRVTATPGLRRAHAQVPQAVFDSPYVGGRANCPACHPGADDGEYDVGTVAPPRE